MNEGTRIVRTACTALAAAVLAAATVPAGAQGSVAGSVALRFQVEEMGRAAFERKALPRSYAANE